MQGTTVLKTIMTIGVNINYNIEDYLREVSISTFVCAGSLYTA